MKLGNVMGIACALGFGVAVGNGVIKEHYTISVSGHGLNLELKPNPTETSNKQALPAEQPVKDVLPAPKVDDSSKSCQEEQGNVKK